MNKFEKELIKIIGTDLKNWYPVLLKLNVCNDLFDKNVQKYGRVAEIATQIITCSDKEYIKDFKSGELKTVSLQRGNKLNLTEENSKKFLSDCKGNMLTYKDNTDGLYYSYTTYGDNFIETYYNNLTWKHFLTKIETMYFMFYDKFQPDGFKNVKSAYIINILKFKFSNYKYIKEEFDFIRNQISNIDIFDIDLCYNVQKKIRNTNKLLIVKRFKNGKRYEWHLFFKDKQII